MGAEYGHRMRRHFRQILDKDGALVLQAFDHVFIVNDLMAHIDRRAVLLERALDDLDRAHDAGAKSARLRQKHFHGTSITQVAPNSFRISVHSRGRDISNIRSHDALPDDPSPKRMEAQGFVSKNGRLEKPDRKQSRLI